MPIYHIDCTFQIEFIPLLLAVETSSAPMPEDMLVLLGLRECPFKLTDCVSTVSCVGLQMSRCRDVSAAATTTSELTVGDSKSSLPTADLLRRPQSNSSPSTVAATVYPSPHCTLCHSTQTQQIPRLTVQHYQLHDTGHVTRFSAFNFQSVKHASTIKGSCICYVTNFTGLTSAIM